MAARRKATTPATAAAPPTIPLSLAWMQAFTRPCDERAIAQRPYRLDVEGQPGVVVTNGLIILAVHGASNLEPPPADHAAALYRHLPAGPGPDRIALDELRAWLGAPEPPTPPRCARCEHEHWDARGVVTRVRHVAVRDVAIDRDLLAAAVQPLAAADVFVTISSAVKFWAATWRLALMPVVNVPGPYDEIPRMPVERTA